MSEQLDKPSKWKHAIAIGLTLSRLAIAERAAQKIERKEHITGTLLAFVLADVIDGVVARKMNTDTLSRRFLDGAVDMTSMLRAGVAMSKVNPAARSHLAGLAIREVSVGVVNAIHFIRTGEYVQGGGMHKLGTLSIVGFGIAAASHNEIATNAVGTVANLINYGLATDYVQNAIQSHGYVHEGVRHIAFETARTLGEGVAQQVAQF